MENGLVVTVTLIGLALFGVMYDQVAGWFEKHDQAHGYVSFLVVGGVAVTLIGVGVVDLAVDMNAGLVGLACFCCSGLPMVLGSVIRNLRRRADETRRVQALAQEMLRDDEA